MEPSSAAASGAPPRGRPARRARPGTCTRARPGARGAGSAGAAAGAAPVRAARCDVSAAHAGQPRRMAAAPQAHCAASQARESERSGATAAAWLLTCRSAGPRPALQWPVAQQRIARRLKHHAALCPEPDRAGSRPSQGSPACRAWCGERERRHCCRQGRPVGVPTSWESLPEFWRGLIAGLSDAISALTTLCRPRSPPRVRLAPGLRLRPINSASAGRAAHLM